MSHMRREGSILGASLLIAGCSIGAAMLSLPIVSSSAGFIPSLLMLFISWIYMLGTGYLFLEITLAFKQDISIVTMAKKTTGSLGALIAWATFLLLFYSLLVAYIDGGSELTSALLLDFFDLEPMREATVLCFSLFFFAAIYFGTSFVDYLNRVFMISLLFSYLGMFFFGAPHIRLSYLSHSDFPASLIIIPTMIVSFGYHNLIPTLSSYLNYDGSKLKKTLLFGSAIPLFFYIFWNLLILGIIPYDQAEAALQKGTLATSSLKEVVGKGFILDLAEAFAFSAITTSILGVGLSLVDFLRDGLCLEKNRRTRFFLSLLVMLPPTFFTLFIRKIFYTALNFAGGFLAVVLFGLLPCVMSYNLRYQSAFAKERVLPGGKGALLLIALFSLFVIYLQF